jgi:uroporphyrinogen-III decarboxylase
MQQYADEHPELRNGFTDYFRYGNHNRIIHHVATGRISPWIIYNCNTGVEFLDALAEDQVEILMPHIDPDFWQRKFKDYLADTEWVKDILEKAGL